MRSEILFSLSNIKFSYPDKPIFESFGLEIRAGEKVVIQGESGSGKTTLFRLILGFETPEDGRISYCGSEYSQSVIHKLRQEITWLPQDLNLGAGNTSDLISFIFEFQANKKGKPERSEIIDTFEMFGLDQGILDNIFSDLSTGQRQRVGLATCLLLDRDIIFLDEPTSALDLKSKKKVAELILNNGYTVISTSHDPWWVNKCDRVIELNH